MEKLGVFRQPSLRPTAGLHVSLYQNLLSFLYYCCYGSPHFLKSKAFQIFSPHFLSDAKFAMPIVKLSYTV